MTEKALNACLVTVVTSISFLAVAWWASCTFYIGPRLFDAYIASEGKLLAKEPEACRDVDSRSLAALSALLATLVAMKKPNS